MFIKKLNFTADLNQVKEDLNTILTKTDWGLEQQIGLTYRPGATDVWKDSTGSLYDRINNIELIKETEFTEFNQETPNYLKTLLIDFSQQNNFEIGRARFMRLESKRGLTVHADTSVRYHLVICTNEYSYISHTFNSSNVAAVCYHMPCDGNFYEVDTTRQHFVYNGGRNERIHLVISPKG